MRIKTILPESFGQLLLLIGAIGVGALIGIYLFVVY